MDEQTERLRDIFMDVTEAETVTESQEDPRGTLGSGDADDRVREVVERMRERYAFRSDLGTDALVTVARGFFAGRDDAEIAADIEADPDAVARARADLHLVTEADLDTPVDLDRLRGDDRSADEVAADLGIAEAAVCRCRHLLAVREQRRVAGDRFREEFERLLGDRDLATRLTEEAHEDGLEGATEGMETDVSF
ncbi:MAG: conditioned medium-induced protein 4 [Halobacteriales archaeon]